MNFTRWMQAVNEEIEKLCGLSANDLPDFMYRDAFDDGADPKDVAQEVLENEGFYV